MFVFCGTRPKIIHFVQNWFDTRNLESLPIGHSVRWHESRFFQRSGKVHYATRCVDQLSLAGFNVIYEPRFHLSTIPAFSSTTSGPIFRAMTSSLFSSTSGFAVSSACFSFPLQHAFHKHLPLNWLVLNTANFWKPRDWFTASVKASTRHDAIHTERHH